MKTRTKRFSAWVLVVALLFSQGISALAKGNTYESESITEDTYSTSLYVGKLKETKRKCSDQTRGVSAYSNVHFSESEEECVNAIRTHMKNREGTFEIYYRVPEFKDGLAIGLAKQALEHTGVPNEGDYLLWQFEGIEASVAYYIDDDDMCCMEITYTCTYFTNAEQEKAVDNKLEEVFDELDVDDQNDYQKIKAVYNYICTHTKYDKENLNNDEYMLKYTAYAALIDGKAVCQGYAALFYRMMLELGVDTRLIPGTGKSEPHGWNIVELDNIYYNVDATWDAGKEKYEYFLKGDADFADHTRDEDYTSADFYKAYPMAEEDFQLPEVCRTGEHDYVPIFGWKEILDEEGNVTGFSEVTGEVSCKLCGERHKNLETTFEKDTTNSVEPTCTEAGEAVYIATITYNGKEYAGKNSVLLKATGHDFGDWETVKNATKEEEGLQKRTCSKCQSEEEKVIPKEPTVQYQTHVQTYGWQEWVCDGDMSGTSGESKRLEGIRIQLYKPEYDGSIKYRTHVQTYGWMAWTSDGEINGTSGESKRLEAIQIKLTGEMAEHYDIYYRVHAQKYGWLDWAKNGEYAGTAGLSKRLEGIEIVMVKKDGEAPGATDKAYITSTGLGNKNYVTYRTHVQTYGWQDWVYDGVASGTSGESKRLEGIQVNLVDPEAAGSIRYRTHVQTYGWQDWVADSEISGTSGESKRLEAIQIELTGEMAEKYDVYYRVHAQTFGWLDWASNGEKAGTAGYSKRLEAIEIVLVEKNGEAPGNTDNPFKQK